MSDKTKIEWSDATFNPIRYRGRHFCLKISPGCDNCYASTMTRRLIGKAYERVDEQRIEMAKRSAERGDIYLDEKALQLPLTWKQPRKVFVCSMTDIFGEWVPDEWLDRIFAVMAVARQHTFQVLTKRPSRMREYLADPIRIQWAALDWLSQSNQSISLDWTWPLPNCWLGVSVESDAYAWRARVLAEIPAAVRWISAEPLLGPLPSLNLDQINWLIAGGESGGQADRRLVERCDHYLPELGYYTVADHCWRCAAQPLEKPITNGGSYAGTGWRPKPEAGVWIRELRDRARDTNTAFFFKQWGGPKHDSGGRLLDGREWNEMP